MERLAVVIICFLFQHLTEIILQKWQVTCWFLIKNKHYNKPKCEFFQLPGDNELDESMRTFVLFNESHTLGNALTSIISK